MKPLLYVALTLSVTVPGRAFSTGAGRASCAHMKPDHIRAQPQDPRRTYVTLHTHTRSYLPGDTVAVALRSTRDFMGFLLQARSLADDRVSGAFVLTPPGSRLLGCVEDSDTVTHADKLLKRNLSFVWKAPDWPVGDVRFLVTVVQSYFVYWAGVESAAVRDVTAQPAAEGDATGATPGAKGGAYTSAPLSWGVLLEGGAPGTPERKNRTEHPTAPWEDPVPPTVTPNLEPAGVHSPGFDTTPQPCHECHRDRGGSDTEEPVLTPSSPQEGAAEPWLAQHSLLIATRPEADTSTRMRARLTSRATEPPERFHSKPLSPVTKAARQGSGRQKTVVFNQNISQGGEVGPPREGTGVGKGDGIPGRNPWPSGTELGVLLGLAAGLGMALVAGLRCILSQHCRKRTVVSLGNQPTAGVAHMQECGDLVHVRKIRQDSFAMLQAEYSVLAPVGN
ncbi:reelin domain-containing protein 1 [Scleropages formosus]|uniref:reelin domain-containing protein 1 n=1 Tax=Scleropages formosus TaxID=113540 RepID=UPI0010FAA744|nr:reelin domain-containing protein 1 [Scleropages formosus]